MSAINSHKSTLEKVPYDRKQCRPGIIHVGVGAFHRAHQAVYINDLLNIEDQQHWGIVGINLRPEDSELLSQLTSQDHLYTLKTISSNGDTGYQQIGSIIATYDWTSKPDTAAEIAADEHIHLITITVTESGYYLLENNQLDASAPAVVAGLEGQGSCIYTYLRAALNARRVAGGEPITVLCCDNLRDNGHLLQFGFKQFLLAANDYDLLTWIDKNVTFPCCMVDRITPRVDSKHAEDVQQTFGVNDQLTVMSEPFIQWVIEDNFAGLKPPLERVGVQFVEDVVPYEDAKIRLLNAGHTIIAYLAALKGYEVYDQGMADSELSRLFFNYESSEAIPAITDSPIDLYAYLDIIKERFSNAYIGDSVARICADGVSKFPIFVLPTIRGCYAQGIAPTYALQGIASWYVFMRLYEKGQIPFDYIEPKWDFVEPFLKPGCEYLFAENPELWGDVPEKYPQFVNQLCDAIDVMQLRFVS